MVTRDGRVFEQLTSFCDTLIQAIVVMQHFGIVEIFAESKMMLGSFLAEDDPRRYQERYGPYNNQRIWLRPRRQRPKLAMELSQAVTDNLEGDILSFLHLTTEVDDKACLAFIMEASLRALAQGQNLLNTIFAAFLTAQCIESGQLTKRDILDNYCTCPDTFTRANTDHYCMSCFTICPCSQMGERITDDGNLLVCQQCLELSKLQQVHQPYDVLKLIGNRVEAQHRYEVKAGAKPAWDIAEMSKMLSTRYSPLPNEWIDGYSGTTMSLKATIYHPESNMYRSKSSHHPYILSVEKPHNMCLDAKGKIALHYYDNDILTKDCINRVKGVFGPSLLPLLKMSLRLKKAVEDQPPCRGYHQAIESD